MSYWWLVAVGAVLVVARRRGDSDSALGLPLERPLRTTPHGKFGDPRKGPPAHFHQGIDLRSPPGDDILAIGDGVLVSTTPGLGKVVRKLRLDRPAAWTIDGEPVTHVVYADLGPTLANAGERVRRGQAIARVDRAGFFHFATKRTTSRGEEFIDPKRAGLVYDAPAQTENA